MRTIQFLRNASITMLAAAALAGTAHAQEEEAPSVDTLIVTAQKREQNLQDVPVVVTALPEKLLRNNGVRDIKDLTILTPGMTVTSTTSEASTTARIRGVGTVGDNPGLESSVGVVIDGVYRPRNGVGFGELGELTRIEVLKGPQGTLFGKNTSAGVINILTRSPEFDFGGMAEATFGNRGHQRLAASVTGPLIAEKLAARLYAAWAQRDGYNRVITGKGPNRETEDANQDFYTVRAQTLFTPDEDATFRFVADYTRRNESCCGAVQIRTGPTAAFIAALAAPSPGLANPANPSARLEYSNRGAPQRVEDWGLSMQGDFDLAFGKITSITAFRDWRTRNGQDPDFTTADLAFRPDDGSFASEFRTFSQEARIAGKSGPVDWLAGVFFADEQLNNRNSFFYGGDYERYFSLLLSQGTNPNLVSILTGRPVGATFPAGAGQLDAFRQRATTLALFTNNTWRVSDALELTAGLRWSRDTKKIWSRLANTDGGAGCGAALARQAQIAGIVGPANAATAIGNLCLPWANPLFNGLHYPQRLSDRNWSGTLKAAYRVSPQTFVYASYARGYKAGGFNLDRAETSNGLQSGGAGLIPVRDTSFPGEYVDSYELGAKNTLLDRTLLLNATLFYQRYTDFQLNTFLGTSFVVRSIPLVTSKGLDADFLWFTPMRGLSLQGGVTYALTEYGDQPIPNDPANALALLPGARLGLAPKFSVSAAASYDGRVSEGLRGLLSLGAKYTSAYNTGSDLFPPKQQKGFVLVNGRVGLGSADERWTLEVWGQNLFNQRYKQVAFNAFLQGQSGLSATSRTYNPALDTITYDAFLGAPRTFGATLRSRF